MVTLLDTFPMCCQCEFSCWFVELDEHVDTNTNDPHKFEYERKDNSDTHMLITAKITYADKIQSPCEFADDKVPIVDLGTLMAVIVAMYEKQSMESNK